MSLDASFFARFKALSISLSHPRLLVGLRFLILELPPPIVLSGLSSRQSRTERDFGVRDAERHMLISIVKAHNEALGNYRSDLLLWKVDY